MDAPLTHQQLAWDCPISAAVLGRGEEYVLIPLDGTPAPASLQLAKVRGYSYVGVMGCGKDGVCSAKCEQDPAAVYTMMHASFAFAEFAAARLKPADCLERWYSLPDPREN